MNPLKIFRDTTTPAAMAIDATYQGVLAYANGSYAWPQAEAARFTAAGKHLYRIDVNGTLPHGASILDVERYDATPATAATWVPQRNAYRGDATVYADAASVPAVVGALGAEPCWLLVADWTGRPHVPVLDLPPNIRLCAVQYATVPNQYDLTAVYSQDWLGR